MKKRLYYCFIPALFSAQLSALTMITDTGKLVDSKVTGQIKSTWQSGIETLVSAEKGATVDFTLEVAKEDQGFTTDIYIVANYLSHWFMKDQNNQWHSWNLNFDHLVPTMHKKLLATEKINVVTDFSLLPGEILTYIAYRSKAGHLVFNKEPLSFAVIDNNQNHPHRFLSKNTLENYLRETSQVVEQVDQSFVTSDFSAPQAGAVEASVAPALDFGPPAIDSSTTNVQEKGVDEADIIKTDGKNLYVLATCQNNKLCLKSYAIGVSPASNLLLSRLDLPQNGNPTGMFLLDTNQDQKKETLIIISSASETQMNIVEPNVPLLAATSFYGGGDLTNLDTYDVSDPFNVRLKHHASFKGSLLSSRVIDSMLYLVTRYNPVVFYAGPIEFEVDVVEVAEEGEIDLESSSPVKPVLNRAKNSTVIDTPALPTAMIDDQEKPQIQANQCYLPIPSSNAKLSNSITSLMTIPVNNPSNFNTTCIVGNVEAMYASENNIYLTSTQWDTVETNDNISPDVVDFSLVYQPNHSTDIHKFEIRNNQPSFELNRAAVYKGSATVKGHLGWQQDKKSFRMGENKGVLSIATSIGERWNNNSSTQVTLFKQDVTGNQLVETGRLEHLGKPGEHLYSARFTGDRGYLVTFRTTDPLYVLDLSNPNDPKELGSLEIEGYSDFLQPLNDQFILGLGKDAIADSNSTDFSARGAWFQGVKLALFDVSIPSKPIEVDHIILGKRGTESEALLDHHALTILNRDIDLTRIAIPVELHQNEPFAPEFFANAVDSSLPPTPELVKRMEEKPLSPQTYYSWSSTGLYVFDIHLDDTPKIELKTVVDSGQTSRTFNRFGDRSVLADDSAHYITGGNVISVDIAP